MTRKRIEELCEEVPENNILSDYLTKKRKLDELTKEVKNLGELVKNQMKEQDQKSVEQDGFKITIVASERVTWKEDLLLQKAKSYNKPELIKQVEQVDVPVLEQYIIDGVIDINDLNDCKTVTEVVQLRVSKVKETQDE